MARSHSDAFVLFSFPISSSKNVQMAGLDLNELPDDFVDCDGGPLNCTQARPEKVPISIEGVDEPPDWCSAPVEDVVGVGFHVAAAAATGASDMTATAETVVPTPDMFSPAATMVGQVSV